MSLSGAVRVARVRAPSRVRVIVVTRSLWNFLSSLIPSWFSLTRMRPATPEGSEFSFTLRKSAVAQEA